jgi:hypothetical protein
MSEADADFAAALKTSVRQLFFHSIGSRSRRAAPGAGAQGRGRTSDVG